MFGTATNWFDGWNLSDKIAVIASVVALLQFFALFATVFVMVRTARRQLRAYVLVSGSAVTNVVEGNGIPEARVAIKNFGQTPAYNFVNVTGLAAYVYPPPKSISLTVPNDELSKPIARSVLGPTQEELATTDWQEKARPLTQQEKTDLAEGRAIIYVYGEIRYTDAFGRSHRTKYRYMMGGPVGVRPGGWTVPCDEGNTAT
jgi:hypothetical protein